MPASEYYGILLAACVLAVAAGLWLWHRVDVRRPGLVLSDEDAEHFARQFVRRGAVAAVMSVLAGLIFVGSITNHRVNDRPNPVFIGVWLVVFALIGFLLVVAGIDWAATRRYARRQRSAIVREGMSLLREELKQRAAQRSGRNELEGGDD